MIHSTHIYIIVYHPSICKNKATIIADGKKHQLYKMTSGHVALDQFHKHIDITMILLV
jgi:hypothetical protein